MSVASVGVAASVLLAVGAAVFGPGLLRPSATRAAHPTNPRGPRLRPSLASAPMAATSTAPVLQLQDLTPEQALAANQAIPFATLPNPAAKAFSLQTASPEDRARAETCLTQAVYYEAGFEPVAGEQAVAQVVLNRLRHPVYPKTVCGVVFQGSDLKTGCQFTFTCDGAMARAPEPKAWARAEEVAAAALNGFVMKAVGEATHYHTQYVVPYWSPSLVKLTQIGQHIFYRWTGTFGQPPAFAGRYAGAEPGAAPAAPVAATALAVVLPASPAVAPPQPIVVAPDAAAVAAPVKTLALDPTPAASPAQAVVSQAAAELAKAEAQKPEADAAKLPAASEGLVPRPKWRAF